MPKSKHKAAFQQDIDIRVIFKEIYRRKYWILSITVLAAIGAGALSMRLPNQYESSAAVTIRKVESPIQGEPEPLSMETLQQLAESTDLKWGLFEQLWETQALDRWKDSSLDKLSEFERFQSRLFTEIKRQESREAGGAVTLLPVLRIRVASEAPDEAQAIANAWLSIITQRYETFYTEGVDDVASFIGGVFESSEGKLSDQEVVLTQKTNEADLDLKQARFDTTREKAIAMEEEIFDLDVEILTNEAMMQEIAERITEREHEGVWLASAAEDAYLSGQQLGIEEQTSSESVKRILRTVSTMVGKTAELQEFTTTSRLESLKSEASSLDDSVRTANETIAEHRLQLATSERELEFVSAMLAEQEADGVWIGELLGQYYRQALNPVAADADGAIEKPQVSEENARLDSTTRGIIEREIALLKFMDESGIEYKRAQLELLERELETVLSDIERNRKALAAESARLERYIPDLENQPQKIALEKSITDDVLWQELLRDGAADGTGAAISAPLKTEELNPSYGRAQELVMMLTAEVESLKQALVFAEEREAALPGEIAALRQETTLLEMELTNRQEAIATLKSVLEVMRDSYAGNKEKEEELAMSIRQTRETIAAMEAARDEAYERYRQTEETVAKVEAQVEAKESNIFSLRASLEVVADDFYGERTELESLMLEQTRKKQERALKSSMLEETVKESERLQEETAAAEQLLKALNRDIAKLETVRENFATRAEEMALLQSAAHDTSRSGITVLYRAQANPEKLSPSRGKIVVAAAVGAFLLCAFAVFIAKLIADEPVPPPLEVA